MVWEVGPGSLGGVWELSRGPLFGTYAPNWPQEDPNWPQEDPKRRLILVNFLYFFMANPESWALGPRA